jgi:DNA-binding NarL/FixJ family response regulator
VIVPRAIGVRVIASDACTSSALELCVASRPDMTVRRSDDMAESDAVSVTVVDLDHTPPGAIEHVARGGAPGGRVVVLAHRLPPALVRHCIRIGIQAVVSKRLPIHEVLAVIARAAHGEKYVDPVAAAEALEHADCPLTPRERDAMRLIGGGLSAREAATHLHLAVGTVRNLVASACRKIGEPDRARAAAAALDRGWL